MSVDAWPFLVGRARRAGFQVVVLPRFLVGSPLGHSLALAVGADETAPGHAVVKQLHDGSNATLSAVYRVYTPTRSDFGLGDEQPLRDKSARRITVTEGVILRETARVAESAGITADELAQAHAATIPAFARFWTENSEQFHPEPSEPLSVGRGGGNRLSVHRLPPWALPGVNPASRRIRKIAMTAAATTVAIAGAAAAYGYSVSRPAEPSSVGVLGTGIGPCVQTASSAVQFGAQAQWSCSPEPAVNVQIYQFASSAAYNAALSEALPSDKISIPECPTVNGVQGVVNWDAPARGLPTRPGQALHCWSSGTQHTYLWTAPSLNSFAAAKASTRNQLRTWWQSYTGSKTDTPTPAPPTSLTPTAPTPSLTPQAATCTAPQPICAPGPTPPAFQGNTAHASGGDELL